MNLSYPLMLLFIGTLSIGLSLIGTIGMVSRLRHRVDILERKCNPFFRPNK